MADGTARPVIDTVIDLAEIEDGLKRLESRRVFGKIVINL
jgi:alcohol dehydrogenase